MEEMRGRNWRVQVVRKREEGGEFKRIPKLTQPRMREGDVKE